MIKRFKNEIIIDILPLLIMIVTGFYSIVVWRTGIIPPLIVSLVAGIFISKARGYSFHSIENAMSEGVKNVFPALLTIILVGFIISSWILGGIIPTMVYYGFKIISIKYFFPSAFVLTAITSIITGTSFSSIGTIGVSLMIIGETLGLPSPIVASAIVSGAFLGDKMSPLSDTTNISASLGGVDLFEHIRNMMYDTVPAFIISFFIYLSIGSSYVIGKINLEESNKFLEFIDTNFFITPIVFIIPILVLILGIKKIPSNILLFLAVILGIFSALVVQKLNFITTLKNVLYGVSIKFTDPSLNKLFHKGGINEVSSTIITIIFIGCLTGILTKCDILKNLFKHLERVVSTPRKLTFYTYVTSLFTGFSTGAQLLAIILPITLFRPMCESLKVKEKSITRIVEATGTVGITLVPWSVPSLFIASTLNVDITQVIPYLVFPIVLLICTFILTVIVPIKVKKES